MMAMHSSKGLKSPLVVVCGVGSMPANYCDAAAEA